MSDIPSPPAELRARVLSEAKRSPSPTRAEHRRRVAAIALAGAIATTGLFFATGNVAPGARPTDMIAFSVGFALVAAIVLTRLSSARASSMFGRPRHVLVTACVVAAPLLALGALVAAACWPTPAREEVPTQAHAACAALTLLQGVLPLGALLVPKRGSDPVHPAVTGGALGMTAGAWTAMMAYLRCPHAAALHCIGAHVAPTLILTALGAWLGWALLRVK
jgi:hypothetical protein